MRIPNPLELQVGEVITYTLDDCPECKVKQVIGGAVVVAWPGGIDRTYSRGDGIWNYFRRYAKPRKTHKMSHRSPDRTKEEREYRDRAKLFIMRLLASRTPWCPVAWRILKSKKMVNQVHHKAGREGDLLLDERHWMGVSGWGHDWIGKHGNEARRHGWLYEVENGVRKGER